MDLLSLLRVLVVVEPRQLQDQDGREPSEECLLLHVHVKRGRVQAVVEVGVASHLDRVGPEVGLVDKVLVIADALCPIMSIEQPDYWITPVKRSYTGAEPEIKK